MRSWIPALGSFLATGALLVAADRLASRSRTEPSPASSGGTHGNGSPSYFELMKARAERKQGKQTQRWDVLGKRQAQTAADAERIAQERARAEKRMADAARLQGETALREREAAAKYAIPDQDARSIYSASGFVRIGRMSEDARGELRAAKDLAHAAERTQDAAQHAREAARHTLSAAKSAVKAGSGSKATVKAARKDLGAARDAAQAAHYGAQTATRVVRKERAEGRADARQTRAEATEAGIKQGLSDFQPSAPPSDVYDIDRELY